MTILSKVEVHIVKSEGIRRNGLPANLEDLEVISKSRDYFSTLGVGHFFDIQVKTKPVEDSAEKPVLKWRECEIIRTYDRHRTGDIVVWAVYR